MMPDLAWTQKQICTCYSSFHRLWACQFFGDVQMIISSSHECKWAVSLMSIHSSTAIRNNLDFSMFCVSRVVKFLLILSILDVKVQQDKLTDWKSSLLPFLSGQRISHTVSKQSFLNSPAHNAVKISVLRHKISCFCSCVLSTVLCFWKYSVDLELIC